MKVKELNKSNSEDQKNEKWFDDLVATFRTHQIQLATNTATSELKSFYEIFMSNDKNEMAKMSKQMSQQHFVTSIIYDYLTIISDQLPDKLAFDFNDSDVLVWAEIKDDDYNKEKSLILAEAKINAKYHSYGYDMTTMVVEESDKMEIPNHYKHYKG